MKSSSRVPAPAGCLAEPSGAGVAENICVNSLLAGGTDFISGPDAAGIALKGGNVSPRSSPPSAVGARNGGNVSPRSRAACAIGARNGGSVSPCSIAPGDIAPDEGTAEGNIAVNEEAAGAGGALAGGESGGGAAATGGSSAIANIDVNAVVSSNNPAAGGGGAFGANGAASFGGSAVANIEVKVTASPANAAGADAGCGVTTGGVGAFGGSAVANIAVKLIMSPATAGGGTAATGVGATTGCVGAFGGSAVTNIEVKETVSPPIDAFGISSGATGLADSGVANIDVKETASAPIEAGGVAAPIGAFAVANDAVNEDGSLTSGGRGRVSLGISAVAISLAAIEGRESTQLRSVFRPGSNSATTYGLPSSSPRSIIIRASAAPSRSSFARIAMFSGVLPATKMWTSSARPVVISLATNVLMPSSRSGASNSYFS